MKSRVRDGTGRLKERGDGERRGTGRLKERGGGERHAPAKPRLVAVLRSKLRFTRFLQVPTGSHCLSPSPLSFRLLVSRLLFSRLLAALLYISLHLPKCRRAHIVFLRPPSPSGCWHSYFPYLSTFPKCRRAHIVFLRPPLLRAIGLPTSPFSLLSPSADGLTLSFSAPLSFRLLDYHTLLNSFST